MPVASVVGSAKLRGERTARSTARRWSVTRPAALDASWARLGGPSRTVPAEEALPRVPDPLEAQYWGRGPAVLMVDLALRAGAVRYGGDNHFNGQ